MATQEDTSPIIGDMALPEVAEARPAPAATANIPLPAVIGGKYKPVRLIARGGMGAVYEVVHANTGDHLALKVMLARSLLAPDLVERFKREARIHSAVKSENVVRVVDADVAPELDEAPFLVMELLTGQDFERICLERKPSATEVLDWLRQLGIALDKAHAEGIVHRDLKPENVFLAQREGLPPIVKVLDFGIAKVSSEGAGGSTATGQILGTPRYMAPEQAVGAKEVTPAADRFAMGLIAFRLLCGRHYFTGENWVGLLRDVARGPTARPSELGSNRGPAFDAWFARACAQAPKDRFATCAEQVEALGQALAGVRLPGTGWRRARPWVALGAVGAAAVIIWAVGHKNDAPPRAVAGATAPGPASSATPAPATTPPPAIPAVAPPQPPAAPAVAAEPATDSPRPSRDSSGEHRVHRRSAQPAKAQAAAPAPSKDPVWDEP